MLSNEGSLMRNLERRCGASGVCTFRAFRHYGAAGLALGPEAQAASVARADILVGIHGGGMAGMLFMPPGSVVLELKVANPYYAKLARQLGHGYLAFCFQDAAADLEMVWEAVLQDIALWHTEGLGWDADPQGGP